MIIIQTPLRVSLFGGGTDFADYYLEQGGCVLSTAIDKYIFVTIKRRFDQKLRVGYTRTELVDDLEEIEHELIRECLRITGINDSVEIMTLGDIPSAGSGLGSSSTVTVGALHAMYSHQNQLVSADRLAQEACQIEIGTLGKPIGVQDQYIAAFGGLRLLRFQRDGQIAIDSVPASEATAGRLDRSLLLFFTGMTRRSQSVLSEQKKNIAKRMSQLSAMKELVGLAAERLQEGDVDALGPLLHESWRMKRALASRISNGVIDEMYETALRAGASGGKITGAGGGGFLLLFCPEGTGERVRVALRGLRELPFSLEPDGSKVIFNYRR